MTAVLLVDAGRQGLGWFSTLAGAVDELAYADLEAVLAGDVDLSRHAHVLFALGREAFRDPASPPSRAVFALLARAVVEVRGTVGVFLPRGAPVQWAEALAGADDAAAPFLAHPFGDHPARDAYDTTLLPPSRDGDPAGLASVEMAFVYPRGAGLLVVGCEEVLALERSFRLLPMEAALERVMLGAFAREVARWGLPARSPSDAAGPLVQAGLRKTGWMELAPFEAGADAGARVIEVIERAGLDAVWLSVSPNRYWKDGARFFAKKDAMLASVEAFGAQLARLEKPPVVLVAFHPADNFTCPPFPQRAAKDLHGFTYADVPAPLDAAFWAEECVLPLAWFAREWAARSAVPLGGVVFDLELYLRRKTGASEWTGVMGAEEPDPRAAVLEARARDIGERLAAETARALPGSRLAVYMTALHAGWFHRGFLAGLAGASGQPLQLFTFESAWRGSPYACAVHHASVVMLSKLRRVEDAALVDRVLARNHGVWFNRISRVDPHDPRAWHALEQTPLSVEARPALWDAIGRR